MAVHLVGRGSLSLPSIVSFVHLQASQQLRDRCHAFLLKQLPPELHPAAEAAAGRGRLGAELEGAGASSVEGADMDVDGPVAATDTQASPGRWGIAPFYVDQRQQGGAASSAGAAFNFQAPTTSRNALRVLRALQVSPWLSCRAAACSAGAGGQPAWHASPAHPWLTKVPCFCRALPLQLRKPILLEGSPGVGKTSLIAAMAKAVGEWQWRGVKTMMRHRQPACPPHSLPFSSCCLCAAPAGSTEAL
jgi:midasin